MGAVARTRGFRGVRAGDPAEDPEDGRASAHEAHYAEPVPLLEGAGGERRLQLGTGTSSCPSSQQGHRALFDDVPSAPRVIRVPRPDGGDLPRHAGECGERPLIVRDRNDLDLHGIAAGHHEDQRPPPAFPE